MRKDIIGENIKWLRKKNNLTRTQLGNLLEVSYVTVSTWESGRTEPSMATVERLCQIFGCRKEEILGLRYSGWDKDNGKRKLIECFDNMSEDSRHLLLVRAKELQLLDIEKGYYKKDAS